MYLHKIFSDITLDKLKTRILLHANRFEVCSIMDSNTEEYPAEKYSFNQYNYIAAAGVIKEINSAYNHTLADLDREVHKSESWYFGYFSYDLKNKIERLNSNNSDYLFWPDLFFFQPEIIYIKKNNDLIIYTHKSTGKKPEDIINEIKKEKITGYHTIHEKIKISPRLTKEEYVLKVEKIKTHIARGDIYEINFCQEFYSTCDFNPIQGYISLNSVSPTPFSSYFRFKNKHLLSASPERFLLKKGNLVVSQPIKGTARRGKTIKEDDQLKSLLKNSVKERAENIMIVDLVRNDLSKIALNGSVKVDELCGIYSFKQVNQMISTISAQTEEKSIENIIRSTFPMGSMTGAPKIKAMQLAEKYETTKRGLYSGAVGYITPNFDFDFNVVIRSLQYNCENKYLSYLVGGAITYLSDTEMEYEECLIKALAIEEMLKTV